MLVLISPAKSLNLDPARAGLAFTAPELVDESARLVRTARQLSRKKLGELMHISKDLAYLNYDRFQEWTPDAEADNAKQAALLFAGATYVGLDAGTLSDDDLAWAQDHLGILSGLYGVLRPLDRIQPHRLEMGSPLKTRRGANLYKWWGDRITKRINAVTEGHPDRTIINCASGEYFRAVLPRKLKGLVITPVFKEIKGDTAKVIGFVAKTSRGAMARWIVQNRLESPEAIKGFDVGGYAFQPDQSTDTEWVFTRPSTAA